MQRRFRKVYTALREHSCISYAKIASAAGFSDINLIIIKATAPDDFPVQEKYIQQLLKLFSISPTLCHSFAISFTRRFGTTHSWRVALKSLILLHRLLRSVQGNNPLWTELLWTRSNGLISLYPCHFKDASSSFSKSYTNFIISYAHLLDEALNGVPLDSTSSTIVMFEHHQEEKENDTRPQTFHKKMREIGDMLESLPQLQSLIDRVMDCYPKGVASRSFLVQCAMKHIIRDSFICHTKFRKEMIVVLDNLLEMPYRNCIAAFNIYKKAATQSSQLYEFYEWCKAKGLCGFYEYPSVEPIPHMQIKALERFLSGMWQLTESSSSPTSPSSSSEEAPSERQVVMIRDTVHIKGQEFVAEEKPLIDLEDDSEDVSWETLLESSVSFSHAYDQSELFSLFSYQQGWDDDHSSDVKEEQHEQVTAYNSTTAHNPFQESKRFTRNSSYPWGL